MIELRRRIDARPFEWYERLLRNGTPRKCRLLIGACCRQLGLDEIADLCVGVAEGKIVAEELLVIGQRPLLARLRYEPRRYRSTRVPPSDQVRELVRQALYHEPQNGVLAMIELAPALLRADWTRLIDDILGQPQPAPMIDPRWLSTNVLDIARSIYEEGVSERMPILADALMDAGCDDEEILNHCRYGGMHVRGCWVVDLILVKG